MEGQVTETAAPQSPTQDAMSRHEAMQRFTDINTSVNQILTILSKLPQQPSASSGPSTSTTQTS